MTGFFRTGITTAITADANVQADDKVARSVSGFATQTIAGLFAARAIGKRNLQRRIGLRRSISVYGYDRFDWFGQIDLQALRQIQKPGL